MRLIIASYALTGLGECGLITLLLGHGLDTVVVLLSGIKSDGSISGGPKLGHFLNLGIPTSMVLLSARERQASTGHDAHTRTR